MDFQRVRPPLDAAVLHDGLVGPGLPWRRLDVVDETGSTNADLLARSAAGADIGGSVLIAEFQNAGRGRQDRRWSAPPRAQIAMSFGVDASRVPRSGWGWLPLATGVAVVDALSAGAGASPMSLGLKWPNDVLAGPAGAAGTTGKLAGILAEVATPAPVIVVGLGVNVTLTADEAPDPAATSLLMLGSPDLDRNLLVCKILRELATRIGQWRAGADSSLAADYRRHSLTLGTRVRATLPGDHHIVGVARDVDELGRLHIDTGGQTEAISAGDVTHLRPTA